MTSWGRTKREGRTELQKALSVLGDGDVLVVTPRPPGTLAARSCQHRPRTTMRESAPQGHRAERRYLDRCGTRLLWHARRLRSLRDRRAPRTPTRGAKRQGAYKGGKARLDRGRVKTLSDNGLGPAVIARELGIARSSVYRLLEEGAARGN
jgi:DNA invertase Pin-like site-specific DNA recombinase